MTYILYGTTFLLIPIIVNGILGCLRHPKQTDEGKVYFSKFLAVLGTIGCVVFLIPALITIFLDEPILVSVVLLFFSSLGATLIIAFANCRISYDEEGFLSKNFFGIKRKFTYNQVTAIKENMHETYIYVGNQRVMVDGLSIGGNDFIKLVKKKYQTMHDGQKLPTYKPERDIFNGNVRNSSDYLIAFIVILVITVGFLIFTVCSDYFVPSTTSNTVEQSVSFASCEVGKKEIVLTSTDNKIYKIQFVDEQFDAKVIQTICDGEKIVIAYSKEISRDDNGEYYSVKAIVHNDNYLLNFDETNRTNSQEYTALVIIAVAMCLFGGAVIICYIIVGRNPKKFSKRIVNFFFDNKNITY